MYIFVVLYEVAGLFQLSSINSSQAPGLRSSRPFNFGLTQNAWAANAYKIHLKSHLLTCCKLFSRCYLIDKIAAYAYVDSAGAVGSRFQVKPPSLKAYFMYER
jgi:hypothetical protein